MKPSVSSYSNTLSQVVTSEDRSLFLDELGKLEASLFAGSAQTFDEVLAKEVRQRVARALKTDLDHFKRDTETFIQELRDVVARLPEMEITVATELTVNEYTLLSDKILELVGEPVILSVSVNPFILAGAQIAYNGKYGDYTVRRKLEAEFETGLVGS